MRVVKLRKRVTCPSREITIISRGDDNTTFHWRFGPNTVNRWPSGDYYSEGVYREPSTYEYPQMYIDRRYYRQVHEHPAHLLVDIGL